MRRFFFISAFIAFIVYQGSLPEKILEWSLQRYCQNDLSYRQMTLNSHCLVIEEPSLKNGFFSAKQIVVHYAPKWLSLECRIEVVEPVLGYPFKELPLLLQPFIQKLPHLDLELVVNSGRLLNCQFNIEAEKKAHSAKGRLCLFFGEEEKMVVTAASNPEGEQASIEFQKLKIETAAPLLQLKNLEGELDGRLNVNFVQHKPVFAEGDMTLSRFAFNGPHLQGSCPKAHIRIEGTEEIVCIISGDGHFHKVNGLFEIVGSYPQNTLKWDFQSIKGEGRIDSHLQLKGVFDQFDFVLDLKRFKGAFVGKDLSIEKYLPSFKQYAIKGVADLEGRFDLKGLDLAYRLQNLKMESSSFSFETANEQGSYRFDFREPKQSGRLALKNGTLKYGDLVCTDISSTAHLMPGFFHFADLEMNVHGIPFIGAADIDFEEKLVDIRPTSMQSSVTELQALLKKPLFFKDCDGVVNFRNVRFSENGQMAAEMELTQGRMICPHGELSQFRADIRLLEERMELKNLRGTCLLDTLDIPLTAGSVEFAHDKAFFDLSFGDLKLSGQTTPLSSDLVNVVLDYERSHFGEIRPSDFSLVVNGLSIKKFQLDTKFSLSSLAPYAKRWGHHFDKAEGEMQLHLHFDEEEALRFRLDGQNIALDATRVSHFLCAGRKKRAKWSIDQAEMDNLSFSADLTHTPESWKINFLGLRYKEALLMGLEGEYSSAAITGRVNLLEADLAKLDEVPFLKSQTAQGTVHAKGEFHLQFSKMAPKWKLDALLTASLRSVNLQGMAFSDQENIPCHIRSDRGIVLQNLESQIFEDNQQRVAFKVEKVDYDFNHEELEIESLNFEVPHQQMRWLAAKLPSSIPDLSQVKQEGDFKGCLNVQKSPGYFNLRLTLDKGKYRFYQFDHDLDQFTLDIDPAGLNIGALYRIQSKNFQLECHSQSLKEGELHFPEEGLVVNWEVDSDKNIVVKKAVGSISGISMDLVRDQEWLLGKVSLTPLAISLLPSPLQQQLAAWNKGFSLKGRWKREAFQGELIGSDFDYLKGQVTYTPGKVIVRDFCLKDPECHLQTDHMAFEQTETGDWLLSIPQILIQDLKSKTFTIKTMDVKNFKGALFSPSTYTGSGTFSFINSAKRNLPTLFTTPTGLDTGALIPVKGTIDYEIKEKKICFTKLKNVYSEGKVWKFSLSNSGSYLDFSGNLNVRLGMKQGSPLLKLTDLYTFNIEGSYEKPTYSLQRQKAL